MQDEKDAFAEEATEGQEEVVDIPDAGEDDHAAEEEFEEDLGELK